MKSANVVLGLFLATVLAAPAFGSNFPRCFGMPANDRALYQLSQTNRRTEVFVKAQVISQGPSDNRGLRHELLLVAVGQMKVTIAHDTSIAQPVPVTPGEWIFVCGEFLPAGPTHALIHWTHYDPHHQHVDGYIAANNQIYGLPPGYNPVAPVQRR